MRSEGVVAADEGRGQKSQRRSPLTSLPPNTYSQLRVLCWIDFCLHIGSSLMMMVEEGRREDQDASPRWSELEGVKTARPRGERPALALARRFKLQGSKSNF